MYGDEDGHDNNEELKVDLKSAVIEAPGAKKGAFVYGKQSNNTSLNQSASSEAVPAGAEKKKKSGLSKIAGAFMKKLF